MWYCCFYSLHRICFFVPFICLYRGLCVCVCFFFPLSNECHTTLFYWRRIYYIMAHFFSSLFLSHFLGCYLYQLSYSPRALILKFYSTVFVIELIIKKRNTIFCLFVCLLLFCSLLNIYFFLCLCIFPCYLSWGRVYACGIMGNTVTEIKLHLKRKNCELQLLN